MLSLLNCFFITLPNMRFFKYGCLIVLKVNVDYWLELSLDEKYLFLERKIIYKDVRHDGCPRVEMRYKDRRENIYNTEI